MERCLFEKGKSPLIGSKKKKTKTLPCKVVDHHPPCFPMEIHFRRAFISLRKKGNVLTMKNPTYPATYRHAHIPSPDMTHSHHHPMSLSPPPYQKVPISCTTPRGAPHFIISPHSQREPWHEKHALSLTPTSRQTLPCHLSLHVQSKWDISLVRLQSSHTHMHTPSIFFS